MTQKKILALIDAENLYYAPKKIWGPGSKLDYKKLFNLISKKSHLITAIAYLVADPVVDQNQFIKCLIKIGYTPKIKTLYSQNGQIQNSNWDEDIIKDGLAMIEDTDELVMVSGDSDFIPMLKVYKEQHKSISIICFQDNFNPALRDYSDSITFLKENILLNYRPVLQYNTAYPRPRALPNCRFPMQ